MCTLAPLSIGTLTCRLFYFQVHRRLVNDDGLGVGEPLNETGVDGRGLIVRGMSTRRSLSVLCAVMSQCHIFVVRCLHGFLFTPRGERVGRGAGGSRL